MLIRFQTLIAAIARLQARTGAVDAEIGHRAERLRGQFGYFNRRDFVDRPSLDSLVQLTRQAFVEQPPDRRRILLRRAPCL